METFSGIYADMHLIFPFNMQICSPHWPKHDMKPNLAKCADMRYTPPPPHIHIPDYTSRIAIYRAVYSKRQALGKNH